jgi:hypothetical protein
VALTAGRIYIAFLYTSGAGSTPSTTSIEATGLSMTKIITDGSTEDDIDGGQARVEAWIGKCTASGTVTVTASFDAHPRTATSRSTSSTGVDNATGTSAVVQGVCGTSGGSPGTSLTITMGAFADSRNRPLAFVMHRRNEGTTTDSGGSYTELLDATHDNPQSGFEVQWHSGAADDEPDWSWGSSAEFGGIALELAILPDAPLAALLPPRRRRREARAATSPRASLRRVVPVPAAQSLGVVSFAQWSRDVELVEGDEIRITLSGPAADQPQVRLSLGFKQVH